MGGEGQGEREPHLGERGGSEREHGGKGRLNSEGRKALRRKGRPARRAFLGEVEGSMSG